MLVRSDSPEVTNSISSKGVLACWGWSLPTLVCIASAPGLLITLIAYLTVSVHAAVWLGVPVVLALNGYMFWRGRSPRLNWVIAGCADRVFVRLFVQRGRGRADIREPDVIMFEASEIASIFVRTVEVFLYGPKPKIVESLVIKPTQTVAESYSNDIRSLPCSVGGLGCSTMLLDSGKQVYVDNEKGRLIMKWKWYSPILPVFLQQLERECPSIVIVPEERSELDLNEIWNGTSMNLDVQQRQKLVQAVRLGFDCDCAWLLRVYKGISPQKADAYLAEIEQEEAGRG